MGRKLIQLLEVPSLTHELYVFTRKDLCFGTSQKCLLSEFSVLMQLYIDSCRKNISRYIWPRLFIQTIKCYLLDKKIVYQSFYGAPLTFSYFLLQGKVLFRTRRQVTCEMFISKAFRRPCRKNNISGYIWHKLFIQTVKCSLFNHVIVDQSFYGALLTISYFLLQAKIVCFPRVGNSLARCLFP